MAIFSVGGGKEVGGVPLFSIQFKMGEVAHVCLGASFAGRREFGPHIGFFGVADDEDGAVRQSGVALLALVFTCERALGYGYRASDSSQKKGSVQAKARKHHEYSSRKQPATKPEKPELLIFLGVSLTV
jgi:hypothetical protein